MVGTVEAIIDERGNARLLETVELPSVRRALVMILEEGPAVLNKKTALLSESALVND